jgi:hypothetical protein
VAVGEPAAGSPPKKSAFACLIGGARRTLEQVPKYTSKPNNISNIAQYNGFQTTSFLFLIIHSICWLIFYSSNNCFLISVDVLRLIWSIEGITAMALIMPKAKYVFFRLLKKSAVSVADRLV